MNFKTLMQSDDWYEQNKKSYYQLLQSLQQKLTSAEKILCTYIASNPNLEQTLIYSLSTDIQQFKKVLQNIVFMSCVLDDKKQREQTVITIMMQNDGICLLNDIEDQLTYIVSRSIGQEMCNDLEIFKAQRFEIVMMQKEIRFCCNRVMIPNIKQSELVCRLCAKVYRYNELIFEKNSYFTGDKGKTKPNKYNPMRNFNKWMDKITCKDEQVDITILDKITAKFEKDHRGFKRGQFDISVKAIRRCLKQLGLSKYNTRLSFIKQYLTLQQPPNFSETDIRQIADYYSQIIHIYYHLSNKYNIPYCPHIIAKIVENIFPDDQDKQRIKQFIHFQNQGTVWKFDTIWKQICSKLPGFVYTPVSHGFEF